MIIKCERFINKQASVIVGFEVLTKAAIKITLLWVVMLATCLVSVSGLACSPHMKKKKKKKAVHS